MYRLNVERIMQQHGDTVGATVFGTVTGWVLTQVGWLSIVSVALPVWFTQIATTVAGACLALLATHLLKPRLNQWLPNRKRKPGDTANGYDTNAN